MFASIDTFVLKFSHACTIGCISIDDGSYLLINEKGEAFEIEYEDIAVLEKNNLCWKPGSRSEKVSVAPTPPQNEQVI